MSLKDLILPGLALVCIFYLWGMWRNWHSAGWGHGVRYSQAAAYLVATLVMGYALSPGFDALADHFFFAHMLQHLFLILLAAPLFDLSAAGQAFLWALPRNWAHRLGHWWGTRRTARRAWGWLSGLWISLTLYVFLLWLWHIPFFYQAAVENDTLHGVEHLCFLFSAMLFWWALFENQRHHNRGTIVMALAVSMVQMSVLGALITFAAQPIYPIYQGGELGYWRFTTMSDQQLAGLIMWLPGGLPFMALLFYNLAQWLEELEKAAG